MNRDRNKKPPAPKIVPDTWFSVQQSADYMNCTVWYLRRQIQTGRIPYAILGHRHVLKREDLDLFVESQRKPVLSGIKVRTEQASHE
jgi:excisionase family DNA binding protein